MRALVTKRKRAYAEARTTELVEPSPERVEPRAVHPGAPWQVLSYERQLAEKQTQVRDALTRIGHFEDPPVATVLPAEDPWRYRNKLEYSFGEDETGQLVLGFHRPGRWNEIDDVTDDVLNNLENLLGRGRSGAESVVEEARERGTSAASGALRQAEKTASDALRTADPVIVQADRARRVAGVGASFPITGYDNLTAAQVRDRLDTLNAPELRKVRDYERRNANRKTVLSAVESKLS